MQKQTWVLLRGLVREQRHWEAFPQVLAARLPDARIVMVDLPGNGVRCRERSPLRVRDMVDSLRADLAARDISGPFSVLALSLGAMIALEWMSHYPAEVERAVLVNTSLSALNPFWQRLRPQNYGRIVRDVVFHHDPEARERLILDITVNRVSDREVYVRRWVKYAEEQPVSLRNAIAQLVAAGTYRRPAHSPHCPVLVLNGQGDRLVDPRCSERVAAVFGLPLESHPTAGHDVALDAPDWLAERTAAFAARTG